MKSAMLSLVMCLASVHAIVDTDNCKCFKDAVHDAKAAALAAAGDHSGETHQEGTDHTGSGESIEVEEEGHATVTTVETGEQCNPEKQFDALLAAANGGKFNTGDPKLDSAVDPAAIINSAEAKCTEEQNTLSIPSVNGDMQPWTAVHAKACQELCLRCGCRGFNFANKTDGCFPAAAQVELADGTSVTMAALKVGDVVRVQGSGTGAAAYSKVYMFTHRDAEVKAKFVKITTSTGATLRLTSGHYLYVDGKLRTARTVKVGDVVSAGNVTAVTVEWADGLYNPHTMTGDIVVDGVLTSTYTDAVAPSLAHALLWPVRMLSDAGVQVAGDDWDQGGGEWTAFAAKFGLNGDEIGAQL